MDPSVEAKKIGAHVYGVRKLPAGVGLPVLAKLLNLIGPAIKEAQDGDGRMARVVSGLLSNEKLGEQLQYFAEVFSKYSTVDTAGRSVELAGIYDLHFAGNYFELVQWLVFCFEVNHGSFLAEAGVSVQALVALAVQELSSRSPKQPETPGRSGRSSSPAGSARTTAT